jgi:protein phosphatase
MGGHAGGAIASTVICQELPILLKKTTNTAQALITLHSKIIEYGLANADLNGMGATVILAQQKHSELQLFWIGDCRAYQTSKTAITLLTKDHTIVQNLLELGLIDKTQAINHPKRHIVTQCIGGNSSAKPQIGYVSVALAEMHNILLCSDGLYNELNEQRMQYILQHTKTEKEAIKDLVESANIHGGHDNISEILLCHTQN